MLRLRECFVLNLAQTVYELFSNSNKSIGGCFEHCPAGGVGLQVLRNQ